MCLVSPPRRSLSAPCTTLRHVCSVSAHEDSEGELRAEVVEAASSLANPRLRITRVAFLFPSCITSVSSSAENTGGSEAWELLSNSRARVQSEIGGEPVIFDRLRMANSQIHLLNSMNGHTLQRCAELEKSNVSLGRALMQAIDENRHLNERLQKCLKELDEKKHLVAVLQRELQAARHATTAR
ncbi:hypothetical protein TraAM80_07610 [Trypanosoma rangeli]|uniref:Uncharacterized protein n=1 Tax=Trypanosoma rangeli TaxID=5698 RepID=A0A422N5A8_TRYRA|nr:uncharacterized protein TraAM80_07610 [Trypanosoma rangeli]RNF00602.1 hypothetical protein TraAM80_07610 [Trypanosoma rangeli]|eukprot:RNF00602.1 hypothetical protein TraAM80_07610 [Trypanosoma rangeli]